jgi:hypothetical protein
MNEAIQRPQRLGIHLKPIKLSAEALRNGILLGWTGLASSSSLANFSQTSRSTTSEVKETIDLDPQLAQILGPGFAEGDIVSCCSD